METNFFSDMLPLCMGWVGLPAISLLLILTFLYYRRGTRRASTGPSLLTRIWQSIVGFFMEQPDTAANVDDIDVVDVMGGMPIMMSEAIPAAGGDDMPVPVPDNLAASNIAQPTPAPAGAPADAVEVLRVWRDLADGALIIDFGGRRYRHLRELNNPGLRRRFISILRALNQMLNVPTTQAQTAPAPAPKPRVQPGGTEEAPKPARTMLGQVGKAMIGKRPAVEEIIVEQETLSIAEQIDNILQYRLKSSELADRAIRIRSSFSGGVTILVDDHSYEAVGDVEDTEVRALLRSVIQEWEAKQ